jgi:hypothetical protein
MVAMTQALWVIYEKPPVENPSIGVVEIKGLRSLYQSWWLAQIYVWYWLEFVPKISSRCLGLLD